ncbi:S-adenosyl-L-methionine-dependent methyltransferase [Mycena rosella]|uniref:S-adenosyl-L-methionine-dependent methyltransferase n=1 Tax=Mycena rosella TaxID=1033263 RepID=A0AAD7FUA4_MYCRO|nr:S-adenosyl-L-methionine-dependent methyltransferase [Mycena rosella]
MSVKHEGIEYPCALGTWFSTIGNGPCPDVGMWMVEPDLDDHGDRIMDIIHIDSILPFYVNKLGTWSDEPPMHTWQQLGSFGTWWVQMWEWLWAQWRAKMIQAVRILEGACAQLCVMLARPNHTTVNVFETNCLHVALSLKTPDILQEKPEGMHLTEISKHSGVEQDKLARILRYLASNHCFREAQRTADPIWGPSYAPEHTAWNKFSKQPQSIYTSWQTPEACARGERFGLAMLGWGNTIDGSAIATGYPWQDLGKGATVCDLGSGVGTMTMELARVHPQLQLKLQDMPERMVQAKNTIWLAQCPEALEENHIEFKAINFFTESPIPGCDVYYLKNILHNWPDAECITILKGVKKSMKPGSRVLIHEYILQSRVRAAATESNFMQAPELLLANYGIGKLQQYNLDLTMLVLCNSKERTLQEFASLGEAAGLRFERLWELGELAAVEFRL